MRLPWHRHEPDASVVVPYLVVGSCPTDGADREALHRMGVRHVVDLRGEREAALAWPPDVVVSHVPMVDRKAPTIEVLDEVAELIAELMTDEETVLVHCRAGQQRTAMVALAALMRSGYSLSWAWTLLRRARPVVNPTEPQLALLDEYERWLREHPDDDGGPLLSP